MEDEYEVFQEKLKKWSNLINQGLCNGLTHTHMDERRDDIDWLRKRLSLFENFSKCVMNFQWGNDWNYNEKELKEIAEDGYSPES